MNKYPMIYLQDYFKEASEGFQEKSFKESLEDILLFLEDFIEKKTRENFMRAY